MKMHRSQEERFKQLSGAAGFPGNMIPQPGFIACFEKICDQDRMCLQF
jgi:hypothetical protein